ncbi:MAG: PEP-CTERM sorting domain-containing protein [Chitinispirillaceae bacterium]|nr:PEP-CTERM sorting domain-containing protein [Chitinispirillaceae bacterium]
MFKNAGIIKVMLVSMLLFGVVNADWLAPTDATVTKYQKVNAPAVEPDEGGLDGKADPRWQILGESWGADDGVSWQINRAGAFVDDVFTLNVGDEIQFKFDMYKTLWGVHDNDAIKVWVGDEVIDLYTDVDLTATSHIWDFYQDDKINYSYFDYYNWNGTLKSDADAKWDRYFAGETEDFYSGILTVGEDFNLTARVTCSDDLSKIMGGWENLTLNTDLWQGETENYCFTTKNVPEPTLLSLLGCGLLGLLFIRRKK